MTFTESWHLPSYWNYYSFHNNNCYYYQIIRSWKGECELCVAIVIIERPPRILRNCQLDSSWHSEIISLCWTADCVRTKVIITTDSLLNFSTQFAHISVSLPSEWARIHYSVLIHNNHFIFCFVPFVFDDHLLDLLISHNSIMIKRRW